MNVYIVHAAVLLTNGVFKTSVYGIMQRCITQMVSKT
jgi:hypothetical protein